MVPLVPRLPLPLNQLIKRRTFYKLPANVERLVHAFVKLQRLDPLCSLLQVRGHAQCAKLLRLHTWDLMYQPCEQWFAIIRRTHSKVTQVL